MRVRWAAHGLHDLLPLLRQAMPVLFVELRLDQPLRLRYCCRRHSLHRVQVAGDVFDRFQRNVTLLPVGVLKYHVDAASDAPLATSVGADGRFPPGVALELRPDTLPVLPLAQVVTLGILLAERD
jgi:hypothetical protein